MYNVLINNKTGSSSMTDIQSLNYFNFMLYS